MSDELEVTRFGRDEPEVIRARELDDAVERLVEPLREAVEVLASRDRPLDEATERLLGELRDALDEFDAGRAGE